MYAKLRLPPQNRSFSRCILRQTGSLVGLNGRIEPNYFLYRDASFLAGKKSCFFGSPGCVWLLRAARDRFYDKKIDFLRKKSGMRESRVRRRFWESRVRRRRPAITSETTAPCRSGLANASLFLLGLVGISSDRSSLPKIRYYSGLSLQVGAQVGILGFRRLT